MKDMNLIETNLLPRGPEGFRDEVSTIENVCYRLSFRTLCGIQIVLLRSYMPRSSRSMTEYMIYFYPEAELRGIL